MRMRESITAARQGGDGPVFEFCFAGSDPIFAGHFPGRAILPGIFQIEMARMAAEWSSRRRLVIREVSRAKFQRPVLPGERLKLELKLIETGAGDVASAHAHFSVDGQPAGETLLKLSACD